MNFAPQKILLLKFKAALLNMLVINLIFQIKKLTGRNLQLKFSFWYWPKRYKFVYAKNINERSSATSLRTKRLAFRWLWCNDKVGRALVYWSPILQDQKAIKDTANALFRFLGHQSCETTSLFVNGAVKNPPRRQWTLMEEKLQFSDVSIVFGFSTMCTPPLCFGGQRKCQCNYESLRNTDCIQAVWKDRWNIASFKESCRAVFIYIWSFLMRLGISLSNGNGRIIKLPWHKRLEFFSGIHAHIILIQTKLLFLLNNF